jgi:hypothetical protein
VLREVIPIAKLRYATNQSRALRRRMDTQVTYTVDTPVPYRVSDLVGLLEERIGRLENRSELAKYRRLKARVESISKDPRCSFMFGQLTVEDTMIEVLSRLFRVPIKDKPITIMELAGFPSDVVCAAWHSTSVSGATASRRSWWCARRPTVMCRRPTRRASARPGGRCR